MTEIKKDCLELALQTPLFQGFSAEEAGTLLRVLQAECVNCAAKTPLTEPNVKKNSQHIVLLLSGKAQLVCYGRHGHNYIFSQIAAGDLISDTQNMRRVNINDCTYIAVQNCLLLRLDINHLPELDAEKRMRFEHNMLIQYVKKTASLTQKIDVLSRKSVREKILTYLLYESDAQKSNSFDIPFNRQELADYLCIDRTTLSSELSLLQKEGMLRTEKRHVELLLNDNVY